MGQDVGVMSANALSPLSSPGSVAVRSRVWVILIGLLAAMAFVASAPAASAHAKLVSISPADGATVATAPDQVVITFSEDLLATAVRVEVHDAEGVPVTDGAPKVDGAVARQPLVDGLAAGGYSVTYRVVSKDGHPVSGSTTFTARGASVATTTAPSSPGSESPTASTTVPVSTTPVGTGQSSDVRADPAVTESGFPWGWAVAALLATVALAAVGLALRRRPQGEGRHLD
jgi:methionine-rich copper-binding protein CopC